MTKNTKMTKIITKIRKKMITKMTKTITEIQKQ